MASKQQASFDSFLEVTPTSAELAEHVDVGSKWSLLGALLHVDDRRLDGIEQLQGHDDTSKTLKMFQHWLTTTPTASRRQVLEVLRRKIVSENEKAERYENYLKGLYESNYLSPSTRAILIVKGHIQSLNEALVSPVQVSQLLYSKRCISEATLDEIENVDQASSVDIKKTTLLTAMQETVSSNYRKLKDIATVLSDVQETRDIGNKMMNEYDEEIVVKDDTIQEDSVVDSEACACNILRNNYDALSCTPLIKPIDFAKLLHSEKMMSDRMFSTMMETRSSLSDSRAVLLKAVRDAVHSNYKHLELFVTVLRKFSETAHIGDTIFEEYKKAFPKGNTKSELQCYIDEEKPTLAELIYSRGGEVYLPPAMDPEFSSIRSKFGSAFFKAREAINKKQVNHEDIKRLLCCCFPIYESEFSSKQLATTDAVLEVVKGKCNLIDITCIEVVAKEFEVDEALIPLKAYKEEAAEFCKKLRDQLHDSLEVVQVPRPLSSETIVFILNRHPCTCSLDDIKDIVAKATGVHCLDVMIRKVKKVHSIDVTCFVPMSLTGYVITTALQNIGILQLKGLVKIVVAKVTVWAINKHEETKEILYTQESIDEPNKTLETQYRMFTKSTLNNEDLKAIFKQKTQMQNELESTIKKLKDTIKEKEFEFKEKEYAINQEKEKMGLTMNQEKEEMRLAMNQEIEDMRLAMNQEKEDMRLAINREKEDMLSQERKEMQLAMNQQKEEMRLAMNQQKEEMRLAMNRQKEDILSQERKEMQLAINQQKEEMQLAMNQQKEEMQLAMNQERRELQLKLEQSFQIIVSVSEENKNLAEEVKVYKSFSEALKKSYKKGDEKEVKIDPMVHFFDNGVLVNRPTQAMCFELVAKMKDIKYEVLLLNLDSDCLAIIVPAVLERKAKTHLLIRESPLDYGLVILMSKMIPNSSLTSLALCHCSIHEDDFIPLAKALKSAVRMHDFALTESSITSASAPILADLIQTNNSLRVLNIAHTKIGPDALPILLGSLNRSASRELKMEVGEELEEHCKSTPSYYLVKDRIAFS